MSPSALSSAYYVLVTVNYVRKYRVTVSPIVNGRAHPGASFFLGGEEPYAIKPMFLKETMLMNKVEFCLKVVVLLVRPGTLSDV
ncbi:hypothetical protein ALC57_06311 [Trachymyrmex cornetzi]|uniref:Uncharacterized protein n=1 Tax=Trachymyrmex cornetzi TaxID=471704 RepID=A0A195E846_9HYME|nr:hypothetical protein ALC57_06311 [Trachymyrmex cornetzi]